MILASQNSVPSAALSNEQEYRLLFAATFVMFLVAVVMKRLFGLAHGDVRPSGSRQSLFAETKATAYSSLAFAFMG